MPYKRDRYDIKRIETDANSALLILGDMCFFPPIVLECCFEGSLNSKSTVLIWVSVLISKCNLYFLEIADSGKVSMLQTFDEIASNGVIRFSVYCPKC